MKPAQEILVKTAILFLVLFLLIVEILVIDIRIIQIVVTLVAVILLIVIIVVEVRRPKRLCHAFIYQNRETGELLFCKNDAGNNPRDFRKVGEGQVPCDQVKSLCELEQAALVILSNGCSELVGPHPCL